MSTIRITTDAPGRCGIIGNPSDIYGGTVVSCSVPARNRVTIEFTEGAAPVIVDNVSEVPRSSGLAGSTAHFAAELFAEDCYQRILAGLDPNGALSSADLKDFSERLRHRELHEKQVICGFQDAYMVTHGGLNVMHFAGKSPRETGPQARLETLPVPSDGLPFVLITTGVERLSGSVHGPMIERWLAGEEAVLSAMERIAAIGSEGAELMRKHRWSDLAPLMKENHQIVANLGGSGPAIEDLIAKAEKSGAEAAKLAGAGLGGTVIALTSKPTEFIEQMKLFGYTKFMFPEPAPGIRFLGMDKPGSN